MCLKRDYYSGLGSSMHAAYSVQIITSCGFIASCLVTQDRADMHLLIPAVDRFHEMYGFHPDRLGADAGYGFTTVICVGGDPVLGTTMERPF